MSLVIGVVMIVIAIAAIGFTVGGEAIIDGLSVVRRLRSLRDKWGSARLDLVKLAALQDHYVKQSQGRPMVYDPTMIRHFAALTLGQSIVGITVGNPDSTRPVSDLVGAVSYPTSRLTLISHELRLYSGLSALAFGWQAAGVAPVILNSAAATDFWEGSVMFLQRIGERPVDFIAWIEVFLLSAFTARLLSEMANLRQYNQ